MKLDTILLIAAIKVGRVIAPSSCKPPSSLFPDMLTNHYYYFVLLGLQGIFWDFSCIKPIDCSSLCNTLRPRELNNDE